MSAKPSRLVTLLGLLIGVLMFLRSTCESPPIDLESAGMVDRVPKIDPDYAGITIPPNIAPLNFCVHEDADQYHVRIAGQNGPPIVIKSRDSKIHIPLKSWRKLLDTNRGETLSIGVAVKSETGEWHRFRPFVQTVAMEKMDSYLVYRLMNPIYIKWKHLGLYERNLSNFSERCILHNRGLGTACINCHAFANNQTQNMSIHMRLGPGTGMLLHANGKTQKIDTRTAFNSAAAAYTSWHPSGNLLAFSVNKVSQFFHAKGYPLDVWDTASDILLYDIRQNMVRTFPKIAGKDKLETYPNWTPDGKSLIFCSTKRSEAAFNFYTHGYRQIKYDLLRISYDPATNNWGEAETLISAEKTGLSVTHPRVSPDGRFILFCMSAYGNFSIYRPSSDLYLLDLETRDYKKLEINSPHADSYHTWSGNGRWFVFSSKRRDGLCAHPFFCHVDANGQISKPFVLPQKDPGCYNESILTYNVPELISEKVTVKPNEWKKAAWNTERMIKAKLDPKVRVDSESGATPSQTSSQ